ncbi:4-amino-4-deoxychorismate synthase, aminodeoxychorismate synthase subunit [Hyphomonas neptunium ATCC 15444]|uniref:4-amino-4-deoxychorismate synthase, aminodeoxychorismate synthase subunit n=2 Tax=Hyphomonas TaxID=85 RepID=Q0BZM9_HYPNA|nr:MULTISPECIES: anthranilate synthase component I family protein [Hyphomonas]ABI77621.1 4-amino-4-deoxychorismate synthase, aminodeoxychorismate synthase subunit [Hyphomonas neptunium ATCC 15444]KCZ86763.1 4-amino-4-deoxychorismate synthase, aminodeoxychorismate synthase subunit [Hyphomonas hirschiana VP5]
MLAEALPSFDPVAAALALRGEDGFLWLDSAAPGHPGSRYSYICLWPVERLRLEASAGAARDLRAWRARFRAERLIPGAPFQGGVAGYLSYDFAPAFMGRFKSRHTPVDTPALEFGFYDTVIAFNHAAQIATIYSAGLKTGDTAADETLAKEKISRLKAKLAETAPPAPPPEKLAWTAENSATAYKVSVFRIRDYIRDGDIYQANVAALWTAPPLNRDAAFAQYLSGRARSPAPFSAFGVFEGRTIASFSPERLISADGEGCVKAEPIKGTIRREEDETKDAAARAALLASDKDRAENVMIVDLLRNDISRVCTSPSVSVSSLCRLETFANLHHLVSTVEGQLAPGEDGVSLLEAVFPGGSITGAPKLRAMEIIDALEPAARGVFCGSIGWIGHDGAMDFSILIRTVEALPEVTRLWAGAGITLLSDPEAEYDEISLKAERIMGDTRGGVATS